MIVFQPVCGTQMARWTRIAKEAPPFDRSVRMSRGEGLRAERGEVRPYPSQVRLAGPPLGQLEHPLAGGADQLAGDREQSAPKSLRPLEAGPAQGLPLGEHQQVEGQDLQLQVGRVGAERAG